MRAPGPVPVGEHRAGILAATPRLPAESRPLAAAHGRFLAADVTARLPIPAWDNSAMGGFAVRSADVAAARPDAPVTLAVVADVPAGSPLDPPLAPGRAARIATGAVLPGDADAVVALEQTDGVESAITPAATVRVFAAAPPGAHVRRAGEDRRAGELVARAGTKAGATVLAALASAGHGTVLVGRRPRVAVIATGSELVGPGAAPSRGQVPDANSLLVAGLAREAGAHVVSVTSVSDDVAALADAVDRAAGADAVVVTGGVSAGPFDPVKRLFAGSGHVTFATVAMRPGKPQAFGRLPGGALLFGLPGNPVSVWVSFHVFVRPALLTMQGAAEAVAVPQRAEAGAAWPASPGRTQFVPARITGHDGRRIAVPVTARPAAAHTVGSLAAADGYVIVPPDVEKVGEGRTVDVVVTGHGPVVVAGDDGAGVAAHGDDDSAAPFLRPNRMGRT